MPQKMNTDASLQRSVTAEPEAEVRQILDGFSRAISTGKLDVIMEFYAPEVMAFDTMPPLAIRGRDAYRRVWQDSVASLTFPMETSYRDQKIIIDGDNAIAFGLVQTKAQLKDGKKMETLMRNTTVLQRRAGGWKIVHEHNSVPVDSLSGKGLMNLKADAGFKDYDNPTSANRGIDD